MKKILSLIFLFLVLTSCGSNKKNNDDDWDHLGGGGIGEEVEEEDVVVDDLPTSDDVEDNITSDDEEISDVVNIDLNNLSSNNNFIYENNILTISNNGVYILSGSLNGAVCIEGEADKIQVILDNVIISTLDSQNCAAIVFKKNDGERILTIKENTTNTLSDSIGDTENDDAAVIQAKKSSLTINGKGTLILNAKGEDSTGIKVKNELYIFNVNLVIVASNNGIKAGFTIGLYDANIDITSGNDAIKTDIEAQSIEEGNIYTSNPFAGYVYIRNCNIDITSGDNGIEANSYLKIENDNQNLIKIITNNGAPNVITESSSNNSDGKAICVSGVKLVIEDEETDLPSLCEDNYILLISGGRYELNSNADAISSKGNLIINGGDFNISSGDDAIHSEYLSTIKSGNIKIHKCYEGIEGASIEIYGGDIDLVSVDDGINAANSDLYNYAYNIYIGGGIIVINSEGDGVDSNGTIEIAGGKTIIYGPTRNDNCALDADRGIIVNGGTVIALGPSGMVETPASNSSQNCLVYNLSSKVQANTELILKDEKGNIILEETNPKSYQSVVISTPDLKLNSTFLIEVGSILETFMVTQVINKIGTSMGPGGPGRPGGSRPR